MTAWPGHDHGPRRHNGGKDDVEPSAHQTQEPGAGELWILQKDLVRKYDFTNPDALKESRFESGGITNVPEPLREALQKVFDVSSTPK